jgi:16S rRNA (guanine966-N2)-methyltransferase
MRVIGGEFKGRTLSAPEGRDTRPTSDRAREAIFNILEHADYVPALSGLRVLDVFAGSGALGFEALSRGAGFCLFIETDEAARAAIRDNVESFGLFGCTRIHRRDATKLGLRPGPITEAFDLVFMDPPYHKGLYAPAINALTEGNWVKDDAIIVLETAASEPQFAHPLWHIEDTRIYGAARVFVLRKKFISA